MSGPARAFIPDVLDEHLDEMAFLWGQRQNALRSPTHTMRELADLEQRIEAHVEGVLVVGDESLPLLEAELSVGDGLRVFASAYTLLRRRDASSASFVLDAFRTSQGEGLNGLRQALSHESLDPIQPDVESLFQSAPTPTAVAAAEALAFHGVLRVTAPEIERFLADEDPGVRQGGWRLVGYLGLPLEAKAYAAAVRDEEPAVRRTALEAGAWCGEPGVLALGRMVAENPTLENLDALELLAVLGGPDDLSLITTIGRAQELGPERFHLLGAYGHPGVIDLILDGITDPDPRAAVAAAAAFVKITGHDIESQDNRVTLPPADGSEPDEFETEFLDEVFLPDPEKARAHWENVKGRLSGAPRICRGFDLRQGLGREEFALLDMESRWEVCLRARYSGAWDGSPLSLEVFSQRR